MRRRGAKWADVPDGAIAASVADMDLPTPAVVVEASVLHTDGDELWQRLRGGGPVPLLASPPSTALAATTAA